MEYDIPHEGCALKVGDEFTMVAPELKKHPWWKFWVKGTYYYTEPKLRKFRVTSVSANVIKLDPMTLSPRWRRLLGI
jgi:hypothetical protein